MTALTALFRSPVFWVCTLACGLVAMGAGELLAQAPTPAVPPASGAIHLLITDVVMPGLTGRELAERLSAERPDMKVLFMSGYTDDAVVLRGVLAKEMPFVQKPFTIAQLARKVRDVLDAPPPATV